MVESHRKIPLPFDRSPAVFLKGFIENDVTDFFQDSNPSEHYGQRMFFYLVRRTLDLVNYPAKNVGVFSVKIVRLRVLSYPSKHSNELVGSQTTYSSYQSSSRAGIHLI